MGRGVKGVRVRREGNVQLPLSMQASLHQPASPALPASCPH